MDHVWDRKPGRRFFIVPIRVMHRRARDYDSRNRLTRFIYHPAPDLVAFLLRWRKLEIYGGGLDAGLHLNRHCFRLVRYPGIKRLLGFTSTAACVSDHEIISRSNAI